MQIIILPFRSENIEATSCYYKMCYMSSVKWGTLSQSFELDFQESKSLWLEEFWVKSFNGGWSGDDVPRRNSCLVSMFQLLRGNLGFTETAL